jgi:hypothetical protein
MEMVGLANREQEQYTVLALFTTCGVTGRHLFSFFSTLLCFFVAPFSYHALFSFHFSFFLKGTVEREMFFVRKLFPEYPG